MNDWQEQIDETTAGFYSICEGLSVDDINWKPNATTWSVGQILDHLIVINSTYYPILADLKSGNYKPPFLAKFGFMVSFLGKTILKSVSPDRRKKIKTFPIWEPSKSEISGQILESFVAHQEELKQEIAEANHLLEEGVIISSPANKNIVYKLEMAFQIIVAHERRHLEQAKEVLSLLNSANGN